MSVPEVPDTRGEAGKMGEHIRRFRIGLTVEWSDEDECWIGRVHGCEGIMSDGRTVDEAVENTLDALSVAWPVIREDWPHFGEDMTTTSMVDAFHA